MRSFERVVDPTSDAFEALWAVYATALPASEQKSRAALAEMTKQPRIWLTVLKEDAAVIGFSVLARLEGEDVALLEYMATRADIRGSGVGRQIFRHAQELAGGRPLLVEIDAPGADHADDAIRRRRKRFYERLGCRTIDGLDYILPLPGRGDRADMHLMVTCPSDVTAIDRATVRRWLSVLFVEVYAQPTDDPRLDLMMTAVGAHARLA